MILIVNSPYFFYKFRQVLQSRTLGMLDLDPDPYMKWARIRNPASA